MKQDLDLRRSTMPLQAVLVQDIVIDDKDNVDEVTGRYLGCWVQY